MLKRQWFFIYIYYMATLTKKSMVDDVGILLTKFGKTDETRLDDDYISYKIDEIRADYIVKQFAEDEAIDPTWVQDLGMVRFNKVNFADDINITSCDCTITKAFIPQVLSLGRQDLGLYSIISACGKTRYYPYEMSKWMYIPEGHERNKFHYYSRINNALYKNKEGDARVMAVLFNPEDAFVKNSLPIASGSIVNGTVYIVKFGQVVYNGVTYQPNSTFTGITGVTGFYSSIGQVFLNSQAQAFTDLDPYPVSADMARNIILDLLSKEFNIERQSIIDAENDSRDDAKK